MGCNRPQKITVTIEIEEQFWPGETPTVDPIWDNAINSGCAIDAILKNGVISHKSTGVRHFPPIDPFATEVSRCQKGAAVLEVRLQFQAVTFELSGEAVRHLPGRVDRKEAKLQLKEVDPMAELHRLTGGPDVDDGPVGGGSIKG